MLWSAGTPPPELIQQFLRQVIFSPLLFIILNYLITRMDPRSEISLPPPPPTLQLVMSTSGGNSAVTFVSIHPLPTNRFTWPSQLGHPTNIPPIDSFGSVLSGLLDPYWIRIQWPSGSVLDLYSMAFWIRFGPVFSGLLRPSWIRFGSVFSGLLDPYWIRIQWPSGSVWLRIQWPSGSVSDPYSVAFWICIGSVFNGLLDPFRIRIQWPPGSVFDPYSMAFWIRSIFKLEYTRIYFKTLLLS